MNDSEVADYLLANPQFFVTHAELLGHIRLSSPHGDRAISLSERQLERLREKNRGLERQLAELVRYGHENDGLAQKFVRWSARVLAEREPAALPEAVAAGLRETFAIPSAAVRLWEVAEAYRDMPCAAPVDEQTRLFAGSLSAPYCGLDPLSEATRWLPAEPPCASVAILPLRMPAAETPDTFGLLVLGSPDAQRFHPGMATDLLAQIGVLAGAALSRLRGV